MSSFRFTPDIITDDPDAYAAWYAKFEDRLAVHRSLSSAATAGPASPAAAPPSTAAKTAQLDVAAQLDRIADYPAATPFVRVLHHGLVALGYEAVAPEAKAAGVRQPSILSYRDPAAGGRNLVNINGRRAYFVPRALKAAITAEKGVVPGSQPTVVHDTQAAADLVLKIAKQHKQ